MLKWLPVSQNTALEGQAPEQGESPIKAVLRSKGFIWMSYSHTSAFYWSHAGQHFEIRDEGDWCAAPLLAAACVSRATCRTLVCETRGLERRETIASQSGVRPAEQGVAIFWNGVTCPFPTRLPTPAVDAFTHRAADDLWQPNRCKIETP